FVASVILVAGIGGLTLTFGDVNNPVIKITSIAVSMILGIVLNFILKDKKVEKKSTIDLDK
ncbi:MAG: uracil permease, partial [Bacilli bacterium]|nr:uracil permease [Bacilli bacterium]